MKASTWTLLMAVGLVGCRSGDGPVTGTDKGDDGYTSSETGIAGDDTASDDTGGAADDTGEVVDAVVGLALYPSEITVHPGASFPLRVVGTRASGLTEDLDVPVLSADDSVVSVATLEASALTEGEVELEVSVDGLSATASVTVVDDSAMSVTVLDAFTGEPVKGLKVKVLDDDDPVYTSLEGEARVPVSAGGEALNVTAYGSGYVPATVMGVVGRDVVIPVRTEASLEPVTVTGDVDITGVPEGGVGDVIVGMAAPALPLGPGVVDPEVLSGPNRTVELFGLEADVPGNLYVRDVAEDYQLEQPAGAVRIWTLSGALPISELTSGLDDVGDAVALLEDHIDGIVWSFVDGPNAGWGEELTVGLAPDTGLDDTVEIEVPELSLGFSGDEQPLVLTGQQFSDGQVVPTGIGVGQGTVEVSELASADFGDDPVVTVLAQVGGLGSGGASCVSGAPRGETLPDLPNVPEVGSFIAEDKVFSLSSDTDSTLVRVTITGGDRVVRDLYLDGGSHSGDLPDPGFSFGYGQTEWVLMALRPESGTFEDRIARGTLALERGALETWTSCRVARSF